MTKEKQELETKTNALDAKLEKAILCEMSPQAVSELDNVSNVKQQDGEANIATTQNCNTLQVFPYKKNMQERR